MANRPGHGADLAVHIHWKGQVAPWSKRTIQFWVRVDSDAPIGTIITNEAYLADNAHGDTASVTTEVVE